MRNAATRTNHRSKESIEMNSRAVTVYNPQGKLIEVIEVPETPANLTFAGKDRKTLYICARTSLYSLQMTVHGHKLAFETASRTEPGNR